MSSNSFRCRCTAEATYDMPNEGSAASESEEKVQEDIAAVPTTVDEPPPLPTQSVTDTNSSYDNNGDLSGNVIQPQLHTSTKGVTWAPLHIARVKSATAAHNF